MEKVDDGALRRGVDGLRRTGSPGKQSFGAPTPERESGQPLLWQPGRKVEKKKWLKITAYFGDGNHVGGKHALSFLMILEDHLIPDQLPSLLLSFIFVEDLQFFQMLQVIKFAVVRVNISLLEHNHFIKISCTSQDFKNHDSSLRK